MAQNGTKKSKSTKASHKSVNTSQQKNPSNVKNNNEKPWKETSSYNNYNNSQIEGTLPETYTEEFPEGYPTPVKTYKDNPNKHKK